MTYYNDMYVLMKRWYYVGMRLREENRKNGKRRGKQQKEARYGESYFQHAAVTWGQLSALPPLHVLIMPPTHVLPVTAPPHASHVGTRTCGSRKRWLLTHVWLVLPFGNSSFLEGRILTVLTLAS